MAMSGAEATGQIQHMTQFIMHEAKEKADEIAAKATQDFTMEKQRMVEDEKLKIRKEFERRERGLTSLSKIEGSKDKNRCRIQVLAEQSKTLFEVVASAGERMAEVVADKGAYGDLLVGLIEQGAMKIKSSRVLIFCRECDKGAVEAAAKKANVPGCELEVRPQHLPMEKDGMPLIGGIILTNESGKIKVDNTLQARLAIAAEKQLPLIKLTLFNQKKFVDALVG